MNRIIVGFFVLSLIFFVIGGTRFFAPDTFEAIFVAPFAKESNDLLTQGDLLPETDTKPAQEARKNPEKQILENTPQDEQELFVRAQQFFSHGYFSLAQKDFLLLLAKNPQHQEAYSLLIKSYIRMRNFSNAEKTAQQALEKFPTNDEFVLLLGDIFLQQAKITEAKEVFMRLSEGTERNFFLGVIALTEGDHERAQQLLQQVTPQSSTRYGRRSEILQAAYKEFSLFAEGSQLHRDILLAKALNDIEFFELSLLLSKNVLLQNTKYRDAWMMNGYSYLALEKYQFAQNSFQKAYEIDPGMPEVSYFLGRSLKQLGDLEAALDFFQKGLVNGFTPQQEILQQIADAHFLNENYELSLNALEKMLELSDENVTEFIRPVHIALNILKKPDVGLRFAQWALKSHPESAVAWNLRGWVYIEQGDFDHAEADLKKALEIDPKLAAAYLNFGILREQEGKYEEALNLYERVYEMDTLGDIGQIAVERYNLLVEGE